MPRFTGNPKGRPSGLTDPVRKAILTAVRNGSPNCDAAEAAGVSYSTFKNWKRKGKTDLKADVKSPFASFLAGLKRARGQFVQDNLKIIKKAAANKTWTASAWLLERRRSTQFSTDRKELKRYMFELAEVKALLLKQADQAPDISSPPHIPPDPPDPAPQPEPTSQGE